MRTADLFGRPGAGFDSSRQCCDLTAERLRALVHYEPTTGQFTRIKALHGNAVGPLKGYVDSVGYQILKVDYKNRKAHRLAWLYVHGEWPTGVIDHINGDRLDNRIANLRDTTATVNAQNVVAPLRTNRLGLRGVSFNATRCKYVASIMANKVRRFLGAFESAEEASAAYQAAKRELHVGGRDVR